MSDKSGKKKQSMGAVTQAILDEELKRMYDSGEKYVLPSVEKFQQRILDGLSKAGQSEHNIKAAMHTKVKTAVESYWDKRDEFLQTRRPQEYQQLYDKLTALVLLWESKVKAHQQEAVTVSPEQFDAAVQQFISEYIPPFEYPRQLQRQAEEQMRNLRVTMSQLNLGPNQEPPPPQFVTPSSSSAVAAPVAMEIANDPPPPPPTGNDVPMDDTPPPALPPSQQGGPDVDVTSESPTTDSTRSDPLDAMAPRTKREVASTMSAGYDLAKYPYKHPVTTPIPVRRHKPNQGAWTGAKRPKYPSGIHRPFTNNTYRHVIGNRSHITRMHTLGYDEDIVRSHPVPPFLPPHASLGQRGSAEVLAGIKALTAGAHHYLFG